jgi:general secretion pathway protein I
LPLTPDSRCGGFTLLEVLVSVAILGTTMVAVLQLHGSTVALAAKAESMATAARLAKNRMIDLTKDGVPPVEANEGTYEEPELEGFSWAERVEESLYSTQSVKVYEISIEVAWGTGPDEVVRLRTYRLR